MSVYAVRKSPGAVIAAEGLVPSEAAYLEPITNRRHDRLVHVVAVLVDFMAGDAKVDSLEVLAGGGDAKALQVRARAVQALEDAGWLAWEISRAFREVGGAGIGPRTEFGAAVPEDHSDGANLLTNTGPGARLSRTGPFATAPRKTVSRGTPEDL